MPHITTAERIGMKRGREEGLMLGVEQSLPTIYQAIGTIIELKFGDAGQGLDTRAQKIRQIPTLQQLTERLKRAATVQDAEKIFDELELSQN